MADRSWLVVSMLNTEVPGFRTVLLNRDAIEHVHEVVPGEFLYTQGARAHIRLRDGSMLPVAETLAYIRSWVDALDHI